MIKLFEMIMKGIVGIFIFAGLGFVYVGGFIYITIYEIAGSKGFVRKLHNLNKVIGDEFKSYYKTLTTIK